MDTTKSHDPLNHPVVGGAFNRLSMSGLAEEIGLFALEEYCISCFSAGMSVRDLVCAVRAEAGG